uniref:C-type lectin domain-containing protein n=1 Tax=Poecilia latipinna TaxID=48699 RepID=A0A3B3UB58_9TELE
MELLVLPYGRFQIFITFVDQHSTFLSLSLAHSQCREGWREYESKCYFFSTDNKTWTEANAYCVEQQGHLVSFHSEEELSFLTGEQLKGSSKWIGLRHNPIEGGYSWSDGTPLSHTNWGHGEPNNHEDREECVEMVSSNNGTFSWWNDLNCDAHQDWICIISKGKTPIIPPVPPSPVPGKPSLQGKIV